MPGTVGPSRFRLIPRVLMGHRPASWPSGGSEGGPGLSLLALGTQAPGEAGRSTTFQDDQRRPSAQRPIEDPLTV